MNFCPTCGLNWPYNEIKCNYCGFRIQPQIKDRGGVGWVLLGLFIPIVGLILSLVWRTDRPKRARSIETGFLVSIIPQGILFVWAIFATIYVIIKIG